MTYTFWGVPFEKGDRLLAKYPVDAEDGFENAEFIAADYDSVIANLTRLGLDKQGQPDLHFSGLSLNGEFDYYPDSVSVLEHGVVGIELDGLVNVEPSDIEHGDVLVVLKNEFNIIVEFPVHENYLEARDGGVWVCAPSSGMNFAFSDSSSDVLLGKRPNKYEGKVVIYPWGNN